MERYKILLWNIIFFISALKIFIQVNVNQEDLQNFLAAAEELRIKGLSQASSEKLENAVPKMKQVSGGGSGLASQGQPPAKKPRESSPGEASAIDIIDSCVAKLPFLYALKKSYAVQMIHRNWIQHCHKASLFIYFQVQVGVV